jgi:SAM-dependent methyltransferase
MDKKYAQYLLEETRHNYNTIAGDFSASRRYLWPGLEKLAQEVRPNDKVLDLGCGNGRFFDLLKGKKINYIGIDNSAALIEIAQKSHPEADFRTGEALDLSFPDNSFDKVFSIAVLHHIPSEDLRLRFLSEAKRVLRPGGILILTVWDLGRGRGRWLNIKFGLLKILRKSKLDFGDVFVPWQNKVDRYVHCFSKGELKRAVEGAGFEVREVGVLERKGGRGGNLYLAARK